MKTSLLKKVVITTLTALALLGPATVQALDVSEYGVLKGKWYTQMDASTPPDGEWDLYWLSAYVRMTGADSVTEATVQPPGAEPLPALYEIDQPLLLQLNLPGGLTIPDMNAEYPNGSYVLALTTAHDGNKSLTLSLTGDSYPNTPTLLNFAALDTVDPSAAFTLSWSALTGGTANDFIQVRVVDPDGNVMFITPKAGVAGALSGTATSVVVPANTLQPESNYTIRLLFVKVTARNTTGYPGLTGLGGYYKYTEAALTTTVGGGTDTTPPQLVTSIPLNGASSVAVNSTVQFIFDEAMAASQSITWSANVNAANFSYSWSGDGTMLTCTYAGSLPTMAVITWSLNPSSQPLNFKDVAGNPLPEDTYSGSFSTVAVTNNPCQGQDTGRGYGGVTKELTYVQTSAAAPTADPTRPATFLGVTTSPTNNPVTSAKLQVPGGPLLTLTNVFDLGKSFLDMEDYTSQSQLDTARPNGNYTLQLTRTTGTPPSTGIDLTGSSYPPTPQIQNYAACQAVDPAANFTIQWNGFAGAGANDGLGISIVNPDPLNFWQWVAPDPCVPRELANTATSVTIPAGTLQAGITYNASLTYSRAAYSASNAIPDIDVAAFLIKRVNFTLKTTGGSVGSDARFIGWRTLPNGNLELKLQGTVGQSYWIETSDNLLGGWLAVSMQMIPAGGVVTFEMAVGEDPVFFRARKQ